MAVDPPILQVVPAPGTTPALPAPKEPALPDSALYGPAGDVVKAIAPGTEADPAGILLHLLIGVGSLVGRDPYFKIEASHQHTNEFGLLVGESSVARKGTAARWAEQVLSAVADSEWMKYHVVSGLATPQGVLHKLRDDVAAGDPFEHDKRLFSVEEEFATVLRACEDGGLSEALRKCWDSSKLEHIVKRDPMRVLKPHVSLIGHITREEFHAKVSTIDLTNGLLNRFLIAYVRRTKDLALGGMHLIDGVEYQDAVDRITEAVAEVRNAPRPLVYSFAPGVEEHYETKVYSGLLRQGEVGGVIGSMMARSATHVLRLSMIYAMLDNRVTISMDNLNAALALWDFCSASTAFLFSPVIQATTGGTKPTFSTKPRRLLDAITAAGSTGISRQEISKQVFGNNEKAADISNWLREFEREGIIERAKVKTKGRPAERYFLSGQTGLDD